MQKKTPFKSINNHIYMYMYIYIYINDLPTFFKVKTLYLMFKGYFQPINLDFGRWKFHRDLFFPLAPSAWRRSSRSTSPAFRKISCGTSGPQDEAWKVEGKVEGTRSGTRSGSRSGTRSNHDQIMIKSTKNDHENWIFDEESLDVLDQIHITLRHKKNDQGIGG